MFFILDFDYLCDDHDDDGDDDNDLLPLSLN